MAQTSFHRHLFTGIYSTVYTRLHTVGILTDQDSNVGGQTWLNKGMHMSGGVQTYFAGAVWVICG